MILLSMILFVCCLMLDCCLFVWLDVIDLGWEDIHKDMQNMVYCQFIIENKEAILNLETLICMLSCCGRDSGL